MRVGPKQAQMDDSHTFFWLVGVLEGEAYFAYDAPRKLVRIEVEMKDEHVIARMAAMFGLAYMRRDRRHRNPKASVTYRLTLTGLRALQLMKRIQPYMSPRRARAIQQIEEQYVKDRNTQPEFERIPLPPLQELPYTLVRNG